MKLINENQLNKILENSKCLIKISNKNPNDGETIKIIIKGTLKKNLILKNLI